MKLSDEVRDVVRRDGVVVRREHPALRGAIARLVRDGELVGVLPGVYAPVGADHDRRLRLACLARWAPDAVLVGRTAAQLTFWPVWPETSSSAPFPGTATRSPASASRSVAWPRSSS